MTTTKVLLIGVLIGLGMAITGITLMAYKTAPEENPSAVQAVADRDVYYPGTETLAPD